MQDLKAEQKTIFEPKAIVFACNWCAYAGADLAGVSRKQYPANVRVIRTMCSGRLDPGFIMRAFEKGVDGVLVLGCHPGDCQYIEGNLKARKKFEMTERSYFKAWASIQKDSRCTGFRQARLRFSLR